jgi:hypothetical protein
MSIYSKEITIEILKRGRKYFEVCYPGKSPFKLVINEISTEFQVGQTVENLLCEFEYKSNGYTGGGKTYATPVNAEVLKVRQSAAKEEERQSEIERWQGYVESALNENRIYSKGFEKLRSLAFDTAVYADRVAQIKESNRLAEISRWSGYCEERALEGSVYTRGINELITLGRQDLADQYRKQAAEVASQQRQTAQKSQQQQECKQLGVKSQSDLVRWSFDQDWSEIAAVGQVVYKKLGRKSEGAWYKILTVRSQYYSEDGLSFGLSDDSGTLISVTARLATEEEAAPAIAEAELAAQKTAEKKRRAAERVALIREIKTSGDRPEHNAGELLLSTVTPYGGGDWFEIDQPNNEIWYCENNGADGDFWGDNNVRTWGAGAIGWRVLYAQELADRITALIPKNEPVAESTPTQETIAETIDRDAIAEEVAAKINDSGNYTATVWSKGDAVRVYVKTTGRKPKDCGWVAIDSDGSPVRNLIRQGGTIENLYR